MSDLSELVRQNQQRDQALDTLKLHLERSCRRLAPTVYEVLVRQVDHDLMRTDEKELVLPKIREAACEVMNRSLGDESHDSTTSMMVEILTEETWLVMQAKRSQRNKREIP